MRKSQNQKVGYQKISGKIITIDWKVIINSFSTIFLKSTFTFLIFNSFILFNIKYKIAA